LVFESAWAQEGREGCLGFKLKMLGKKKKKGRKKKHM
jgi:hypothetical protein